MRGGTSFAVKVHFERKSYALFSSFKVSFEGKATSVNLTVDDKEELEAGDVVCNCFVWSVC